MFGTTEKCVNCRGTGRVDHFAHIDNGICYACGGKGKTTPGKVIIETQAEKAWAIFHQMDELANTSRGGYTAQQIEDNRMWLIRQIEKQADMERVTASLMASYTAAVDRVNKRNRLE